MDPKKVREFTERYLMLNDCHILESGPTYLITQLSIHADKDLLNRPFYWMYVERMNLPPQPIRLSLIFDPDNHPEEIRGEHLFYGAPRFTKILHSAQKHGRFVRLYEEPGSYQRYGDLTKPYTPWLAVNYKVSYVCDQKRDRLFCLGINLHDGTIQEGFYQMIKDRQWTNKLPAKRYTIEPQLKVVEAVGELEYYLEETIRNEDQTWAEEADKRLRMELEQLESFYPDESSLSDELSKEKKQRREEIVWQFHPRVEIEVVNSGLFYVDSPNPDLTKQKIWE
ncbi:MAG: YqhG family protein [Thermoactinomyces sp.]